MSAKEDLKKKIQGLEDQLKSATASLNEILIAEYPFQPGDVVDRGRDRFTVSSVKMSRYGGSTPYAWGKKKLKSGELGNQEFELYGYLELVLPEKRHNPGHSEDDHGGSNT